MNVHDSERMAGLLEQAGFEATDDAGTPTSW
jgi:tRNA A37 methylthiotransferase MiaB